MNEATRTTWKNYQVRCFWQLFHNVFLILILYGHNGDSRRRNEQKKINANVGLSRSKSVTGDINKVDWQYQHNHRKISIHAVEGGTRTPNILICPGADCICCKSHFSLLCNNRIAQYDLYLQIVFIIIFVESGMRFFWECSSRDVRAPVTFDRTLAVRNVFALVRIRIWYCCNTT